MSRKAKLAERIVYASKASKLAKASRLGIVVSAVLTFLIFAVSYYGEVVGNFTFRVDKRDFQAGLSLVKDPDTQEFTSVLNADKVEGADAMTAFCGTEYTAYQPGDIVCLPSDEQVNSVDGSHNGESYLAYTFYLANAGVRVVDLSSTVNLISATKGAEESIRVRIFINDVGTTYAKVQSERGSSPGSPEIGTVPFASEYVVMEQQFSAFDIGDRVKITALVWYEGEDADHNNNIIGGGVKLDMEFHVTYVYAEDESITPTTQP